jgi:hypothetical protein
LPVEELLMTNWVCRQDGVVFPVGLPRCPELTCRARDAYEQGGDESINVYDLPEWQSVQQTPAEAEVSERLGLAPGDPGAQDSSTDPEPVTGDERLEEPAGSAPTKKPRRRAVPS